MEGRRNIETLGELFAALYKSPDGGRPVIRAERRWMREDYFQRFFPEALCREYLKKSKSHLTWFFNGDTRNKGIRRALTAMAQADLRGVLDEMHRKCRAALWNDDGEPAFDAGGLERTLHEVQVPTAPNVKYHIVDSGAGVGEWDDWRLDAVLAVDASAALSRLILTLAIAADAPETLIGQIWSADPEADHAFMRSDESLEGRIRYSRMLDLEGRHEQAYEAFERIARQLNRPAQTVEESAMYCRMGEMLYTGEGREANEKAALYYFILACLDENPRSYYLLAQHSSGKTAREAMEKAAALNHAPAVRELGMALYNGSARYACARNVEAAKRCFQQGVGLPGADGAFCAYMLGQIYEGQGDRASAVGAYRIAVENGSPEAADRLSRLDWVTGGGEEDPDAPDFSFEPPRHCLLNGVTGCNRVFMDALPGKWQVTICASWLAATEDAPRNARIRQMAPDIVLSEMLRDRFSPRTPVFPGLTVALLSEDLRENLLQAVAILSELQRHAALLGDRALDLVERVEIYVMARHDEAAPMLDAAFAGMPSLYFRVRLCDPALDAADQLFATAPLFLPLLDAPEGGVRLNLIGCGETAMAVLRRSLALPMPAGALSVAVFGDDAAAMALRFDEQCPGVNDIGPIVGCPVPAFHAMACEGGLLHALHNLRTAPLDEDIDAAAARLGSGNYYVIATEDDMLNIRLGILLRTELLKLSLNFDNLPFIAVCVRDPLAGWLTGGLAPETGAAAGRWHGRYDLFPFGAHAMYAPDRLEADPMEKRAQQAHMLYLGLPQTRDARHFALRDYYRRQYNRDNARATAACLIYRMFLAGVRLSGWQLYGAPEEEARLGPAYTRWLSEPGSAEAAVRAEHRRWCCMLLSRGWESAVPEQVAAYVQRGNPGHALHLSKLNPFICDWQALEAGQLLRRVRDAVHAGLPDKPVPDPRRTYEASVRDTERLLSVGE